MTDQDLIQKAASIIRPKKVGDHLMADVGAALLTDKGNLYLGACVDATSGLGFCAEASAIASMITAGEYRIERIVAVWKDGQGKTVILPPCGRCRELIKQVDPRNLGTNVLLKDGKTVELKELLPHHDWFGSGGT
jgi:cytidine deaminase